MRSSVLGGGVGLRECVAGLRSISGSSVPIRAMRDSSVVRLMPRLSACSRMLAVTPSMVTRDRSPNAMLASYGLRDWLRFAVHPCDEVGRHLIEQSGHQYEV